MTAELSRSLMVTAATAALMITAARLVGAPRSRLRPGLAIALVVVAQAGPLIYPFATPVARFAAAIFAGLGLMRVIELLREGQTWPWSRRLFHLLAVDDTRLLERCPPGLAVGSAWAVLGYGAAVANVIFAASFLLAALYLLLMRPDRRRTA